MVVRQVSSGYRNSIPEMCRPEMWVVGSFGSENPPKWLQGFHRHARGSSKSLKHTVQAIIFTYRSNCLYMLLHGTGGVSYLNVFIPRRQVMRDCWLEPYSLRPSFSDIVRVLENTLEDDTVSVAIIQNTLWTLWCTTYYTSSSVVQSFFRWNLSILPLMPFLPCACVWLFCRIT